MKQLTLLVGVTTLVVTAGCAPNPHGDEAHTALTHPGMARLDAIEAKLDLIGEYLGYGTEDPPKPQDTLTLVQWLGAAYEAICALEVGSGVDVLCKRDTGDPDPVGGPPPTPPWWAGEE